MSHTRHIRFSLYLPADRYLRYYRGMASNVSVVADDGRRIAFPAAALRPFVTRDGVQGRFELVTDTDHRLLRLKRIAE